MIRSCLLQYDYSFKTESNCYSIYMNKTFYGHTPIVDGLLNLGRGNAHIHSIDDKRCKVDNDSATYLWHCHLEIIHTDVCGPMSIDARGGYRYFLTFTDDLSRYGYIYLMKHKSETFEKFKEFQSEVEDHRNKKIKVSTIRSQR